MSARAPKTPRPARAAAPPLPDLDALDKTHRQVMVVLAEMHALIAHLGNAGVDDKARKTAQGICKFFSGSARQHHADEERVVFPDLLKSADAALVQHVLRLQQDHGWLEEDWLEIEPQLQAVAEGYSWYELDTLRAALPIFEDLYRDHIALEESMIYPEARRLRQLADQAAADRNAAPTAGAPSSS